jgi:hypothetical protein
MSIKFLFDNQLIKLALCVKYTLPHDIKMSVVTRAWC